MIEFSRLNKKDLSRIIDLMLIEVNKTLSKKEIDLAVSDAAKEFLTEEGWVYSHYVVLSNNKYVIM